MITWGQRILLGAQVIFYVYLVVKGRRIKAQEWRLSQAKLPETRAQLFAEVYHPARYRVLQDASELYDVERHGL